MDVASSTALQLLVVLGVPAMLAGLVWVGVRTHHGFKRRRTAATHVATQLTLRGTSPVAHTDGDGPGALEAATDLLEPD